MINLTPNESAYALIALADKKIEEMLREGLPSEASYYVQVRKELIETLHMDGKGD